MYRLVGIYQRVRHLDPKRLFIPAKPSYTLEWEVPEDIPQGQGPMDVEEEAPATIEAEFAPIPQELAAASLLLTLDMSSFEGLVNRRLEPIGASFLFFSSTWLSK